jgi:16S rRNA (guanine1207-N2)-methyltransferase
LAACFRKGQAADMWERGYGASGGPFLFVTLNKNRCYHGRMESLDGMYGILPAGLAAAPAGAVQFSPLMPGARALESCAERSLRGFTMLAPPGTIERRYALALALRALAVDAPFTILAPKDKGGSRLAAELRGFGCDVEDAAQSHHRICRGVRPEMLVGVEEAIAEGAPRLVESLGLWSQPGVFSWNRIDAASALLARHLPKFRGSGADFGCGIGYLSRAVLESAEVTHITLVDCDRRAVEMAKRNVDASRAQFQWADVKNIPLPQMDFVVTNPPFHDGGVEDQALGKRFIEQAAKMLRKGGACWLVANRHLPYEAVLRGCFAQVRLVTEAEGFKIYEAVK